MPPEPEEKAVISLAYWTAQPSAAGERPSSAPEATSLLPSHPCLGTAPPEPCLGSSLDPEWHYCGDRFSWPQPLGCVCVLHIERGTAQGPPTPILGGNTGGPGCGIPGRDRRDWPFGVGLGPEPRGGGLLFPPAAETHRVQGVAATTNTIVSAVVL